MRTITPLSDWLFCKQDVGLDNLKDAPWLKVTLPHTWNRPDGQDGGADYYRGAGWYIRKLENCPEDGLLFLDFGGAGTACDVYVNGTHIGRHEGTSAFRPDITEAVRAKKGPASLAVRVDNSPVPGEGDYTVFGGLFREVNLISVPETHFNLDYYGAPGVYVESELSGENAILTVHAYIKNPREGQVLHVSVDGDNAPDFETINLSTASTQVGLYGRITGVHRWDGTRDPYLYKITAVVSDETGELDRMEQYFGVREFAVDPEQGFLLNGRPYPLHGVIRREDRQDFGPAVGQAEEEEDIALITEIGANAVRLSPAQQRASFLDLCDRKGLIVWAEIPFSGRIPADGAQNETRALMELVLQNFNRPSVCFWGLGDDLAADDEEAARRLGELANLCRSLDGSRLTVQSLAAGVMPDNPIARMTDLSVCNGSFIDRFREEDPARAIGVSACGAEADPRLHSASPVCTDYSEEYQCAFHEAVYAQLAARPFLWGTFTNLFDFADDAHAIPVGRGLNRSGLVTYDRATRKDAFYFYKAVRTETPFVHLCGRRFVRRTGKTTTVKVYSNAPEVELLVGGKSCARKSGQHVFIFEDVPLRFLLPTTVVAMAGDTIDVMRIRRVFRPYAKYTCAPEKSAEKA